MSHEGKTHIEWTDTATTGGQSIPVLMDAEGRVLHCHPGTIERILLDQLIVTAARAEKAERERDEARAAWGGLRKRLGRTERERDEVSNPAIVRQLVAARTELTTLRARVEALEAAGESAINRILFVIDNADIYPSAVRTLTQAITDLRHSMQPEESPDAA